MAANAPAKTEAKIKRTDHPHIVKSDDTLGGEPRIEDTRISVLLLFEMVAGGMSIEEIQEAYPDLSAAQIHDAVSYGYDHPDEMHVHRERHKLRNILREHDLLFVNSSLVPRDRFNPGDVPPGATVYTWETLPPQEDE